MSAKFDIIRPHDLHSRTKSAQSREPTRTELGTVAFQVKTTAPKPYCVLLISGQSRPIAMSGFKCPPSER
ncbi:unnamed protein product [Zymoseptoria tritici ST99CH_3D7]|uniref:Uncharacterized protein n=2 Tax=Zymoseptoria tritici TaxID=1047171 RepID=A0A1X7SAE1_ZYMT9|nr:unnamed protein product [Zymoseptoria tritici ST99CH_3D7]SMR62395.1 unnamed protein product [Zymoseptoria tritici ST99CH_1E4]